MVTINTRSAKMGGDSNPGGPRALLTDRERAIISGHADDVSDDYRYQTVSRVRRRFKRLEADMRALDDHRDLADEVREVICETEDDK